MNQTPERKLAAIMFTDIAGYTALSAKDETSALKLHKNDRERFFNDNKLVSKVISEWKKVNSSAIN